MKFPSRPPKMLFNSKSSLLQNSKSLQLHANQFIVDPPDSKLLELHIYSVFIQELRHDEEDDVRKTKLHESKILQFRLVFLYSIEIYPNELALKLSQIIQSSPEIPVVRTLSITLMYSLLCFCNSPSRLLSPQTLAHIRQIMLHSLQQDFSTPIFPILSRMVSIIANNVFRLKDDDGVWTEYLDYVVSILDHPFELKKGLWLLLDLPFNITPQRLMHYLDKFQRIVFTQLDLHEDDDISVVAFGSCFTLMFILCSLQDDMFDNLCKRFKILVTELMNEEKHVFVQKGLHVLSVFVCKEIWRFSIEMFKFLYDMLEYISHIDCIKEETQTEVHRLLEIIRRGDPMVKNIKFSVS